MSPYAIEPALVREASAEPGAAVADLLEALLARLADGLLATGRDGRIVYWSEGMEALSGLSRQRVLGRPARDWLAPLGGERHQPPYREVETVAVFPTGHVPLRISCVRAAGPSNVTLGHAVACFDLRRRWRQAADAERERALVELGGTVATAAHQLRNPLGATLGFLDLLASDLGNHPGQGLLSRMRAGLEETNRRIDALLAYARPQPPQLAPLDVTAWLEEVIAQVAARFPRGPKVAWEPRPLGQMRADRAQLGQMLENLLVNAAEAAGAAGSVAVRCEVVSGGPSASAGAVGAANEFSDTLRILVRNRGREIPAGELETIFEPFVSCKAGGTGLGLPLARRVARAHGGGIEALSGGGQTTFVVTLPRDPTASDRQGG